MQAFLLTDEQVSALDAAAVEPPRILGVDFPPPDQRVRAIWERLGHQVGFDPATVRVSAADRRLVYAEPT